MPELNEPLSERELEILRLVATGAANKEIATQLIISPNTVKVHLRNIFTKIGVASRTEATLYAIKIGLVMSSAASPGPDESSAADYAPGIPNVVAESAGADTAVGQAAIAAAEPGAKLRAELPSTQKQRRRLPAWLLGLIILTGVLLVAGASLAGARLLARPTPAPTTAVLAATQAQPQSKTSQRWSEKPGLPSPRRGMGYVAYENAFYLFAGETGQGVDGAVLRYDPAKNTWTKISDKPTPVSDIQAVLLGEKIYIPGGRMADGKPTDRLEVYNPRQGTWESKAPLPVAVSGYALATFEGDLYLFGGETSQAAGQASLAKDKQTATGQATTGPQSTAGYTYLASVYVYNPQQDQWTRRSDMTSPRAFASATEDNGKIFVMGGYDGKHALNLNEAYLPSRDGDESGESPWKAYAPLPEGRYGMGIARLASLIYLLGGLGENGQPVSQPAIQYNSQENQWAAFDTPPTQAGAHSALLASGNFIYIIGGDTAQGLSAAMQSYQAIYTLNAPFLQSSQ